jgi:hypothetical protein
VAITAPGQVQGRLLVKLQERGQNAAAVVSRTLDVGVRIPFLDRGDRARAQIAGRISTDAVQKVKVSASHPLNKLVSFRGAVVRASIYQAVVVIVLVRRVVELFFREPDHRNVISILKWL